MSALLRVAELNAAYAATIDADRLEAWSDFFVDDCLYKITSAENQRRGYSAGIVSVPLHGARVLEVRIHANFRFLRFVAYRTTRPGGPAAAIYTGVAPGGWTSVVD